MTRRFGHAVLAGASVVALSAVVACGGGGGGQSGLPGAAAQSQALFTVSVPSGATTSSTQRNPAFISPNTQSITIALASTTTSATTSASTTANLTPSSPNCTAATATTPLTCTVSLAAPAGNDTFTLTAYQGLNGSGTVLSTAIVSALISATQATTVPVTLGGVIAGIDVTVTNGNGKIPGGYATSLPVIVTVKDASGAAIVGAGNYTNPITLTNTDTSGVTTLSTTTVTSPSTVVTLAYAPSDANSGVLAISGLPVGSTTIGASATGVPTSAISAGTFQYNTDRFFGLGHTRMISGTGAVTTITYNGTGVPSPNPSMWAYNVSDQLTVHGPLTLNGVAVISSHHVFTYTQTSPVTATPAETDTKDQYRSATIGATGTVLYRQGIQDVDVNSGAINSPITGSVPGTTTLVDVFPAVGGWEEDVLPHVSGATWTDNNIPLTETFTNAEVATFQLFADGSFTFNESAPGTIAQTQTAAGTATNVNNGFTTTIGAASSGTIPVSEQTTSPFAGPVSNFTPVNWYPGGATPVQPLYSNLFTETLATIPAPCNVPSNIATQAYVVVQVSSQLDVAAFRNRQQIYTDYFVPNGIGFVCETFVATESNYRFGSGIILSQSTIDYTIGVPNTTSLSVARSH